MNELEKLERIQDIINSYSHIKPIFEACLLVQELIKKETEGKPTELLKRRIEELESIMAELACSLKSCVLILRACLTLPEISDDFKRQIKYRITIAERKIKNTDGGKTE